MGARRETGMNAPRRRVEFDYPARSRLVGDRMHFDQLKRREVISLLGGAAAAWPLAARAEQVERVRRIAVLHNLAEGDREAEAWITAFRQRLESLGWSEGRNLRIDIRWGARGRKATSRASFRSSRQWGENGWGR